MFESKDKSGDNGMGNLKTILDKLTILGAPDAQTQLVEVPEWGGSVFVRSLMGTERDTFENVIAREGVDEAADNFRARLSALCMSDESGERLFSDDDATALGKKSAKALSRVFDVAMELNGMGKEQLDTAEKNSEANPN